MTKIYIIILLWLTSLNFISAQAYEIGLNIGGGNYIGDIGQENYFNPNTLGFGGVFKRTVNPWYSIRLNLQYFKINPDDTDAKSLGRQNRQLSAEANLINFSVGFEYNFIPRNPYLPIRSYHKLTPYIFTGVGIGAYSGNLYKRRVSKNNYSLNHRYNGTNLNIPMILGIKFKAAQHFIISLESGAYYYFTDNLDGTSSYYYNMDSKNSSLTPTTNLNSNDWYTFSSLGLIYTFGDLNCYFNLF